MLGVPAHTATETHEPLLGTRVRVTVTATTRRTVRRAIGVVLAEVERGQESLSMYDEASSLNRWRRGEASTPELDVLLRHAHELTQRTMGAFNPAAEALVARWREAEIVGVAPTAAELAKLIAESSTDRARSLNAIAKGYIVDHAVNAAIAISGVSRVVVNAGGDLVHRGSGNLTVGIEDPRTPYDNAAPLEQTVFDNAALATSGTGRRGFIVGGQRYGHVIDPRTGWPVDHILSASVIAPDGATADALATALLVLEPPDGLAVVDASPGAAALLLDRDGVVYRSHRWRSLGHGEPDGDD